MNETMILPINTSPPPLQAARPTESSLSTGPSFEDILRAQTETPEPKQVAPARPEQKEPARMSSTEEAKADPPAEDQPVDKPKDTQTKPVEDPAAAAALAAAQMVVQPVPTPVVAVEPTAAPVESAPAPVLTVDAAVQQNTVLPAQTTEAAPQAQPVNPAAASFMEQLQAVEAEAAAPTEPAQAQPDTQPAKVETTEPKPEQLKVDARPVETKADPEPKVKLETTPAVEPKVEAKAAETPRVTQTKAQTVEAAKAATGKTETSAAGEQEAPKQVQAPPGPTHAEVTGLEGKTTAATPQFTEPARLAEAQTSDMIGQITRQMDQMSQSGRTTLRMQLNPNELGQIDLKITTTPQGVGITILADSANTGKLLETQVAQLRQSLMDAGVQISNLQVGAQNAGQQQQSFGSQTAPSHNQYNTYRTGSDKSETEAVREVRSRNSLIDYTV